MRPLYVMSLLIILSGCQTTKDPLQGAYWANATDGWPALCVPGEPVTCLQPAIEDRKHFHDAICGVEPSAT